MKVVNLGKTWIFIFILTILIFILTAINNYYFYQHVERSAKREMIQIKTQINDYFTKVCQRDKLQIEQCKENIKLLMTSFSEKAYYNDSMVLKNTDGTILWEKPTQDWDKVVKSDLIVAIPSTVENYPYLKSSTDFDNYLVFISVIRSLTFSIVEFIEDINKDVFSKNDGVFQIVKEDNKYIYFKVGDIEYKLNKYFNFLVKEGEYLDKKQLIASGNIYVGINNFLNMYWYRSRPAIGFIIFSFLILYFYKKRIELLQKIHNEKILEKENEKKLIQEENQKEIENLEKLAEEAILEREKLLTKQNDLEKEYKLVCEQFREYESFVKFAFNETSIDELLKKNRMILGNMFRLIAEKIVYSIFESNIRPFNKSSDSLDSCLREVKNLNMLSKKSINALFAIKNFGNENSHYNSNEYETSLSKTIVIAKELIDVIEEFFSIEKKEQIENKTKITKVDLKI